LPKNSKGHVQVRLSKIVGVSEFLFNSKNTPVPGLALDCGTITKACNKAIGLFKFGNFSINEPFRWVEKGNYNHTMDQREGSSTDEVLTVKREFAGLVFSPLDRNAGETILECPTNYSEGMACMFNNSAC
jgi:hypothetical protein